MSTFTIPAGTSSVRSYLTLRNALLIGTPFAICAVGTYFYRRRSKEQGDAGDPLSSNNLERVVQLKNKGNKLFKAGRYEKAVDCYTRAIEECPPEAAAEQATFYQNRAAAKENLHDLDGALEDCSSALKLSPRYLKALNRRAHLYEKLERLQDCLFDVTACCILENFQNADNVLCVERVLKKVGQDKALEERRRMPRNLPSDSFISNYIGAFAWNPFEPNSLSLSSNKAGIGEQTISNGINDLSANAGEEIGDTAVKNTPAPTPPTFELPEEMKKAYDCLVKAIELLDSECYTACMSWIQQAVDAFDETPSVTAENFVKSELAALELPHAAKARANLLLATFRALLGDAEEARTKLIAISEDVNASDKVRVNAIVKAACLSMTVDQDLGACLYTFQQGQALCPDCPDVYIQRGQIHLLAEQYDEALHDFNMAVQLKPNFSVSQSQRLYTLYRRALSDGKTDRVQSRVDEFRRLADKYPQCLETHTLYAQVLTEREDFEASDVQFTHVIELAPTSGVAYAHRGLLQLRWRMDRDAAYELFRKGAEIDPKCELVHELMGQLAVERGQLEEALRHFDEAVRQTAIQNDLARLISCREGIKAQLHACKKYNISIPDMLAKLQHDYQQTLSIA